MAEVQDPAARAPEAQAQGTYTIQKREYTRWWEVRDPAGELVCLTVYRRGAREVVRRLGGA